MRLLGISIASLSSGIFVRAILMVITDTKNSGLGELTFLQLSTTYSPALIAGRSIRYEGEICSFRRLLNLG